ncbi:MAG: polyribonucleotide nucleotidyltransferase [Candidatus Neomarinimicrobiota bacterium]|nr:MAG: polyribonucleotide nucleotidyltransferase [Candidatus Neomarinimicrobiota bacterium]
MTLGGRKFSIETGRMAKQAFGSVVVQYGDTMVLVTATANFMKETDKDFLPLQCEYREKTYAAGKIPGGFFKREGRPSEKEVLSSRLIDRPIRPLFPEGFFCDTQIIANLISSDKVNPGDVLAITGASAALSISEIPFDGPIAGVRVGRINGEFILNPTIEELEETELEIVVAGSKDSVVMVEGESKEISEDILVRAIEFGHEAIIQLINFQKEFIAEISPVKYEFVPVEVPKGLKEAIASKTNDILPKWREQAKVSKKTRANNIAKFIKDLSEELSEQFPDQEKFIAKYVDELIKQDMRKTIVETHTRIDGRDFKSIRPITCEVGVLPCAHGSALFTRGETQSLGSVTLGTKLDEQVIDDVDQKEYKKKFMLHYNFPPFSVGEVRPIRGTGRREIGHGNLAERALKTQIPTEEDFPYTIRIVSDILESNGSSSMASVCAGSLSMMDAGIPVKKTVAGIAMGLIKEGDQTFIITDILGAEDHYGDMDFKVTGTRDGITAIQMDLKIKGLSTDILRRALEQAREGRLKIIDIMEETIKEPRPEISKYAPKMITIKVDSELIGEIIGPGGKIIRAIQTETGAKVEISDDGTVFISASDADSGEKAKRLIENITTQPEEGKVYRDCTVKRLESYGAFIEFLPGKEGLMHISEVAWKHTANINDVLKLGDKVDVKLKKIAGPGRFELSMKELLEKPQDYVEGRKFGYQKSGNNRSRNSHFSRGYRDRR